MQSKQVIGGEFDVDIQGLQYHYCGNHSLDGIFTYSSGRSALYYLLLDIKQRYGVSKIYLPDYLCSSVVTTAEKIQMQVVFYNINDNLEINVNTFQLQEQEKAVVLIINYFGLKDLESQINTVRTISKDAIIIEDDVQAFYEFHKPTMLADYKFTSLRKTFACPDGGLVKSCNELKVVEETNKFYQYKMAASILKSIRKPEYYDDEVYLHLFEKGEGLIDDEIEKGMSDISKESFLKTDIERKSYIRQRNAKQIVEGLKSLNIDTIIPVSESSTPLFIPVWLKDRDKVRKQMFRHQIFCPVHWPLEGMSIRKGAEMAEHEMSIIIDQRYTNMEMTRILETLEKAIK